MNRCIPHDLLPGQCECSWQAPPPDYDAARARTLRQFGRREEDPQVTATVVVTPTTDDLRPERPRLGHDIPRIGYGHWAVLTDDRATRDLKERREAARAAKEREALIAALFATPNPNVTVTIR